jgi:peptidoglycan/xylan/chitin deacetylase (PgdA/CDA1 family)
MYHRIASRVDGVPDPTWNVTPERLREQLSGLLSLGFRAIALDEVLRHLAEGRSLPRCCFAVSFDDGYENFYLRARPILQELSVPATVFVATAYLDAEGPFPFDDWFAAGSSGVPVETWKPLSTEQCVELCDDELIEVGTHTHTHVDFRRRAGAFRRDVRTSMETLRRLMGRQRVALAFPFGFVDRELVAAARAAGVSGAFGIRRKLVWPQTDRFHLGRFEVEQRDSPEALARSLCERGGVRHRIRRAFRKHWSRLTGALRPRAVLGGRAAGEVR